MRASTTRAVLALALLPSLSSPSAAQTAVRVAAASVQGVPVGFQTPAAAVPGAPGLAPVPLPALSFGPSLPDFGALPGAAIPSATALEAGPGFPAAASAQSAAPSALQAAPAPRAGAQPEAQELGSLAPEPEKFAPAAGTVYDGRLNAQPEADAVLPSPPTGGEAVGGMIQAPAAAPVRDAPTPPSPQKVARLDAIDWARGLAITLMIPRNLAGVLLGIDHPVWFRLMGALVPALFMTINGFVITHSISRHGNFPFYFWRGVRLLLVSAIVVDAAIWRVMPFMTVDVLTTIAILIPTVFLAQKLPAQWQLAGAVAAFAAALPLQLFLGYSQYPYELDLGGTALTFASWAGLFFLGNHLVKRYMADPAKRFAKAALAAGAGLLAAAVAWITSMPSEVAELAQGTSSRGLLHHYLVDGWFPIFPWIGFGLLGSWLATHYRAFLKGDDESASGFAQNLRRGLAVLAAGIAAWLFFPPWGELISRGNYTIPIFPPTWQYLLLAPGGVMAVIYAFYKVKDKAWAQKLFAPLKTMGRRSLEIYILHLAIGYPLFNLLFGWAELGALAFVGAVLLAVLMCYSAAWFLERIKAKPLL